MFNAESMEKINTSIIIVTFNRLEKLKNVLASIELQEVDALEVVVVVDGSTDETLKFLDSYTPDRFTLRVISHSNRGRSISRNSGAKIAQGETIIFFDDDMILQKGCVASHIVYHQLNKNCICVGTQEENPAKIINDFDQFRFEITKMWEYDILNKKKIQNDIYLTAANFSIPKKLFFKLNGFNRGAEVVEDFDLGIRASSLGVTVNYNELAKAYHDNQIDAVTYVKKQIEYYESFCKLANIHSDAAKHYKALRPYSPNLFKRIVYFLTAHQFLIHLIDKNIFVLFIPKSIRFKLYDHLIIGLSKVYPKRFKCV